MGLLTDPSAGQSKIIKILMKYYSKFCIILYLGGIIAFCMLAYRPFNAETYFSENALLPGLVRSEYRDGSTPHVYYRELLDEMEKYESKIPYSWLLAKFKQLGLDTYTHNFTLNYPLGKSQKFTGKNVYGILRAARAASTESVVLSVPYRPPLSIHQTTAPAIAIMLAFAKFANKEKYWAKDIIFLVTEHEQLGMQAWLEAYHGISGGKRGTLNAGDMRGRAGAIQAAINLELHSIEIGEIDIKIEGLNGQLPNLDLFNLATRMCAKEGVSHTFKNRIPRRYTDPVKDWKYTFQTMLSMVATQATGIPNGNHGLFYRFGIQALTLEGFANSKDKLGFITIGRILEGTFRSLNNLLERFHQSFFFYLLASSDRYVSIGLYIPTIAALAATLFIKAYAKWCLLHDEEENSENKDALNKTLIDESGDHNPITRDSFTLQQWEEKLKSDTTDLNQKPKVHLGHICSVFVIAHLVGFGLKELPTYFAKIGVQFGYTTESSIYIGLALSTALIILVPIFIKKPSYSSMIVLDIFALLEMGNLLICVAMYNISLAMFCGAVYIPFALLLSPTRCRLCSIIQKICWILLHPFVLATITVFAYTFFVFWNELVDQILFKALSATQQAIMFSIVDSMVYGNWLFSVACTIMTSNWICFWYMCQYRPTIEEVTRKTEVSKQKVD
ncbi:glycosylphosphatidylinositol anchor attachment 1 protein [Holotrichia oblita]|uniref:Glycosylphosphatidylinositol anchor attachment 1 protein n=1 Tax=Holotrichia oblita TaxID=644536 RepID=A0ACB9TR51_HOLOL|nr:glycosylphosphatidylinositol anchor attachment 1 protein [Holotrichia oblita]